MDKQSVTVGVYHQSVEDLPLADVYRMALRKAASASTLHGDFYTPVGFSLVSNSLIYHDSRAGQSALFIMADREADVSTSLGLLNSEISDIWFNHPWGDPNRDGASTDPVRVPLSQYGCYDIPSLVEIKQSNYGNHEERFAEFMRTVGNVARTPEQRFALVNSIERNYLPRRIL